MKEFHADVCVPQGLLECRVGAHYDAVMDVTRVSVRGRVHADAGHEGIIASALESFANQLLRTLSERVDPSPEQAMTDAVFEQLRFRLPAELRDRVMLRLEMPQLLGVTNVVASMKGHTVVEDMRVFPSDQLVNQLLLLA